jgi:hypothetical protein
MLLVDRAQVVAKTSGLPFVPRSHLKEGQITIVVEEGGAQLPLDGRIIRSHPGNGLERVRRLARALDSDPLVDASTLRPREAVLVATFGLGEDAAVLAHAVGRHGKVVGVESRPLLTALAVAGSPYWARPANDAMRWAAFVCCDHASYLRKARAGMFDVVYLNLVFERPAWAPADEVGRRLIPDPPPVTSEDIAEACRVARRWVIVRDTRPGLRLDRLNIPVLPFRAGADAVFGRLPGSEQSIAP